MAQQFTDADRLREKPPSQSPARKILGMELSRDQYDFDVGKLVIVAKSHAVDAAWHADIRQHEANIIAACQYEHRFVAIGRFDNHVSSGP